MIDDTSLADFFYNIIPGSLFIFFLKIYYNFDIIGNAVRGLGVDKDVVMFLVFIVFGLFVGFIFQSIGRIFRYSLGMNKNAKIEAKEQNKIVFEAVKSSFNFELLGIDDNDLFDLMDTSLRAEKPAFLTNHFSSRFTFWGNLHIGSSILLIFEIIKFFWEYSSYTEILGISDILIPIFYLFSIYCFYFYKENLTSYYDVMLKSYYMLKVKNEVRKNKK